MNRIQLLTHSFKHLKLCTGFSTATSSTDKRVRLPRGYNKPSSYALFVKDNFEKGSKVITEGSRIAKLWKEASKIEKQNYASKADEIGKQRYAEFSKLPADVREVKMSDAKEVVAKRKKGRIQTLMRKFKQEKSYPVRPMSAYNAFIREYVKAKKVSSRSDANSAFCEGASAWKNLSDDKKEPYLKEATKLSTKFKTDLQKWKKTFAGQYRKYRAAHIHQKVARKAGLYYKLKAGGYRKKGLTSRRLSSKKRITKTTM